MKQVIHNYLEQWYHVCDSSGIFFCTFPTLLFNNSCIYILLISQKTSPHLVFSNFFLLIFRKPDFFISITAEPTYFKELKKHTCNPFSSPQTTLTAKTEKILLLMDLHAWLYLLPTICPSLFKRLHALYPIPFQLWVVLTIMF